MSLAATKRTLQILLHKWQTYGKFYVRMSTQDKVALFCMLQAVFVMVTILYILLFMHYILIGDNVGAVNLEELAREHEAERTRETYDQQKKNKMYWLQGTLESSANDHNFTLFHYDKLRQFDVWNTTPPMVTEENEYAYFTDKIKFMEEDIPAWFEKPHTYCNGCVVVYGAGQQVMVLKNVLINPQFGHGQVGGETIDKVIGQREEHERITIEKGYFVVETQELIKVKEALSPDLSNFMNGLMTKASVFVPFRQRKPHSVIALMLIRHEYANFYHTTMYWYDVFLTMVVLNIDPYHLEVIWFDGHPKSNLDDAWTSLFGTPVRAGAITDTVQYETMIWSGFGAKSHINLHKTENLPFVEAFRHFVLARFDIDDNHVRECGELRITIIWRRGYVAHPRNPEGHIPRKIANEEAVWMAARKADRGVVVNGVQLDRLSFGEQLGLIVKTDILIGMHGAGLSHILYLPKTSGVIELFPFYTSPGNGHFRSMSRWRRLRYMSWVNRDTSLEMDNHATEIPLSLIQDMIKSMKNDLCN